MRKKRIFALIALALLIALYVIALFASFFKSPYSQSILMAALFCTIVLPVAFYGFQVFLRISKKKTKDQ